jgi:hypothetical protein
MSISACQIFRLASTLAIRDARLSSRLHSLVVVALFTAGQLSDVGSSIAQELPILGPPEVSLESFRLPRLPPQGPTRLGRENSESLLRRDHRGPGRLVADSDDRDWAFFAADSFESPVPPSWQVREAAFGRDIRMVLSPARFKGNRFPNDCIWVSYTVDPVQRRKPLETLLTERLRAHSTDTTSAQARPTTVGGFPAILTEFSERRRGVSVEVGHLLVAADWCVFEIQWSFPRDLAGERRRLVQDWLREIKLTPPDAKAQNARAQELPPHIAAASPVVGSWKAYRSRLRFYSDGRVMILMDPKSSNRVDRADQLENSAEHSERLVGTFQGQSDLLYVVWDDGSKLNFRWRVDGDRLLLTDHEGQISQLRRLLE